MRPHVLVLCASATSRLARPVRGTATVECSGCRAKILLAPSTAKQVSGMPPASVKLLCDACFLLEIEKEELLEVALPTQEQVEEIREALRADKN
jgi:hypothetical protein